jgi:hypothetical protein
MRVASDAVPVLDLGSEHGVASNRIVAVRLGESQVVEASRESGLAAVGFVERECVKRHSVGRGAVELLQGAPPSGSTHHLVGNIGFAATFAVVAPGITK